VISDIISNKILFIIDEVELKYFEFNKLVTNFWLIAEFLKREWDVYITTKNSLYLEADKAKALCQRTSFDGELLKEDTLKTYDIESFSAVFFRPDPPVDIDYINATYVLSFVDSEKTFIINSPQAIRDHNEKLYINNFPELAPDNIVTSNSNLIRDFLFKKGQIILKPLNRCFGSGVFYLNAQDKNIKTIIDTATNSGKTVVMAQEYLPEISKGDKRLIFICGEIHKYCVVKKGSNNDFKFNNHTDENIEAGVLTKEEEAIEARISKKLLSDGIYMAGLDVIDGKIIEINITSPCFFIKEINEFYNINLEKIIVERLERLILSASHVNLCNTLQ